MTEWDGLDDRQQLELAEAALRFAAGVVAGQAEILAGEIDAGTLPDMGASEALRLLAGALRASVELEDGWPDSAVSLAGIAVAGHA